MKKTITLLAFATLWVGIIAVIYLAGNYAFNHIPVQSIKSIASHLSLFAAIFTIIRLVLYVIAFIKWEGIINFVGHRYQVRREVVDFYLANKVLMFIIIACIELFVMQNIQQYVFRLFL